MAGPCDADTDNYINVSCKVQGKNGGVNRDTVSVLICSTVLQIW
jgi:hypothetical protein